MGYEAEWSDARMKRLMGLMIAGWIATTAPAAAIVGPSAEHGPLERHVVMILTRLANGASFCSGVVIAPDVILTAAHCVRDIANSVAHFRDGAGQPVMRALVAIAIHPEYRANAIVTRQRSIDLALARLTTPLPDSFEPAPLSDKAAVATGDRFRVAGFGLTRERVGSSGGAFRWATLAARAPLSKILLWAEGADGQALGACTGDSGGPIFSDTDASVVAITNWTTGAPPFHCGALTQGALVAPQRAWIDGVLATWRTR